MLKNKIIKFIGFSGSGKTTLIEKIVKKLSDNGVKVATIKHDVHGLDIDKEGKDSYRYSAAWIIEFFWVESMNSNKMIEKGSNSIILSLKYPVPGTSIMSYLLILENNSVP